MKNLKNQSSFAEAVPVGQSTDQAVVRPDVSVYISSVSLNLATKAISDYSRSVADGFIGIGLELSKLSKSPNVLSDCGYSDIYDYGERAFGFKRTSVKNFIAVYDRFGDKSLSNGAIDDKYDDYSFTQLVELLPVDDVSSYKPDMTVLEIRDKKILDRVSSQKTGLEDYLVGGIKGMLSAYSKVSVSPIEVDSWRQSDFGYSFSCVSCGVKVSCDVYYSLSKGFSLDSFKVGKSAYYVFGDRYPDFVALAKVVSSKISEGLKDCSDAKAASSSKKDPSGDKPSEECPHVKCIDDIRAWRSLPDADRLASITGDSLIADDVPPFIDSFYSEACSDNFQDVTDHDLGMGFPVLFFVSVTPYDRTVKETVVDVLYVSYKGGRFQTLKDSASALALIDDWCDDEIKIDDGMVDAWNSKKGA